MKNTVLILPGFGLGTYPVLALQAALNDLAYSTCMLPLPEHADLDAYVSSICQQYALCSDSVVIGWSLGGQIATMLAAHAQCRLVTLASNPCFCADDTWSYGMAADVFARFCEQQQQQPRQNLQQFAALAGLHDAHPDSRQHLKRLKAQLTLDDKTINATHLRHLHWLQTLDTRALLSTLSVPQLHVFGANDALIPESMPAQLHLSAQAQHHVVAGASHLLPLTHSHTCAQVIDAWLNSLS
ncbi:alpha/beta fold hydrolase [Vitreoscilla massiliensis]|uniref:Alpha/beta fold hydrolase n=1 Tax=Vitreoscilla massiliensis TaxID=1689272 RepID=A0ABY4E0X9_9NEIS|nr:alpha/beta fold hydrolase [Vitreoscilla massiliensis]UOO87978.1 alpha/beta fold hydrolase [Vitreoscilla massiliensis]